MNHQAFVPMVEVTRGELVESGHRGAIAVVDASGRLVASLGNAAQPIFVRSCAKPIQALALVCSGAADAFGVTEEELAVACASHSGEPEHVRLVSSLLGRAGIDPSHLRCGIHPPFDGPARRDLARAGAEPSALHNNCSGKHAAMLVTARHLGLDLDGYTDPEHGVQVAIQGLLAFLAGMEASELAVGVDGCTAPTFYVPIKAFALAMARLAAVGEGLGLSNALDDEEEDEEDDAPLPFDLDSAGEAFPVSISEGMTRVWRTMRDHPVLIAGTRGRLCTDLMQVARAAHVPLVAKSGAEGAYAMSAVVQSRALGVCLKIEDGGQRARDAAAIEVLLQLGILSPAAAERLAGYHHQVVLDRRDQPVGEVHARFRLNRGLPA